MGQILLFKIFLEHLDCLLQSVEANNDMYVFSTARWKPEMWLAVGK